MKQEEKEGKKKMCIEKNVNQNYQLWIPILNKLFWQQQIRECRANTRQWNSVILLKAFHD